jgi:hypothetical protein
MKTLTTLASAAVLAASIAAAAAPAQAAEVLFASFNTGTSNAQDIDWVRSGQSGSLFTTSTSTATTLGATAVKFSFLGDPGLADFDGLKANFTLSASVTSVPAEFDGSTYTQTALDGGTFSFVYSGTSQTIDGFNLVQNSTVLFSGSFNNAWLQGAGGVGGLAVSLSNGGNATFASGIYDFSHAVAGSDEFTIHLGNVSPVFGSSNPSTGCTSSLCAHVGDTDLNSFRAHIGGDFQDFQLAVPEPTTWALMIIGFGGAGVMLRRRRMVAVAA